MIRRRALLAASGALMPIAAQAQAYLSGRFYSSGMKQRVVRFQGAAGATLEGTLALPLRSELHYVPGVVLIAGSGPTDRDGNNPFIPVRVDLLSQIAVLLADAGIASLRYDKRGIGASTPRPDGFEAQERFFAWSHFVDDVQAAHAELLRHDEIKKYATGFLGHSEGGLLALAACAAMGAKRPHALILAGTPGKPLRAIVRDQIERSGPAFTERAERIMAAIVATGRVPDRVPPELQHLFPAHAGPFLKDAFVFDPAAALARLDNACLLLHGAEDRQVVPFDDIQPLMDVLARRSVNGEVLVAQATSHNLKPVATPFDQGFAGPISPAIASRLTSWLAAVLGA